ncbi:MAG: SUKH-3 domain-containing protein [Alphaproteobacteria bacterium]
MSNLESALRKAGWYPGRDQSAQIPTWRSHIEANGCTWIDHAAPLLREFGGLRIQTHTNQSFLIDPGAPEPDRIALEAEDTGLSLCPIGEDESSFFPIVMDARGVAWILFAYKPWPLGNQPMTILRCLYEGVTFLELPMGVAAQHDDEV